MNSPAQVGDGTTFQGVHLTRDLMTMMSSVVNDARGAGFQTFWAMLAKAHGELATEIATGYYTACARHHDLMVRCRSTSLPPMLGRHVHDSASVSPLCPYHPPPKGGPCW